MNRTTLLPAALAALASLAGAQSLTLVEDFEAEDVRETAAIDVAGSSPFAPARWSPSSGVTEYPGASRIKAINPAGLTYAGFDVVGGALQAARYNIITGWTTIPSAPAGWPAYIVSNTVDISDGGLDVVGFARFEGGSSFDTHAFRWSLTTGLHFLTSPLTDEASNAYAISGDGQRIVGAWTEGLGYQAVAWDPSGARTHLLPPGFSEPGDDRARATNSDGSVIVGNTGLRAFLWSEVTGATKLPTHPEVTNGMAPHAVSDDGRVVVGTNGLNSGPTWIWTEGQGTRLIRDIAAQLQLPASTSSEPFQRVEAMTLDGLRIVGTEPGGPGTFIDTTWILELPETGVGVWNDLGQQLPGSTNPTLNGFGSLGPDTPGSLTAKGLQPLSTLTLVVGFTDVGAPFKGGVLVPAPDLLFDLPTSLFGTVSLPFTWPVGGIPSGTAFYFQGWFADAGAPKGLAATNALEAITP